MATTKPLEPTETFALAGGSDDQTSWTLGALSRHDAELLGIQLSAIDPWVSYPYSATALTNFFTQTENGAPRYCLRANDAVAGVICVRNNWLCGPYLQFLGIVPQFQNRGAGAAVVTWMETEARHRGDRNLWVAASSFNLRAMHFYQRAGFVMVAALPDLVRDGKTEFLLRKRLV